MDLVAAVTVKAEQVAGDFGTRKGQEKAEDGSNIVHRFRIAQSRSQTNVFTLNGMLR